MTVSAAVLPVGLGVVGSAEQLQFPRPRAESLDDAVDLVWFVGGGSDLGHQNVGVQPAVQKLRLALHTDQTVLLRGETKTAPSYITEVLFGYLINYIIGL